MISSYFLGCPRSVEFIQPTIILTVFFWENKQINKQLSTSLGSLIFAFGPHVNGVSGTKNAGSLKWSSQWAVLKTRVYPFRVDRRKRRFSNTMMSYIIQRMPCMVCFRFSIVLAFPFGRAKIFFSKTEKNVRFIKYPYTCERDQI